MPAVATAGTRAPTLILKGATVPTGAQAAQAYLATRRSQASRWLGRLTAAHQTRVRAVDFQTTILVAGFLDGSNCAFDLRLQSWARVGNRLVIDVTYRKPPLGVATCVRTSVGYLVLGFKRTWFSQLPTAVKMRAHATA